MDPTKSAMKIRNIHATFHLLMDPKLLYTITDFSTSLLLTLNGSSFPKNSSSLT